MTLVLCESTTLVLGGTCIIYGRGEYQHLAEQQSLILKLWLGDCMDFSDFR